MKAKSQTVVISLLIIFLSCIGFYSEGCSKGSPSATNSDNANIPGNLSATPGGSTPSPTAAVTPSPSAVVTPTPSTGTKPSGESVTLSASRVESEAKSIKGVKNADAFIEGSKVYLGIEFDPKLSSKTTQSLTNEIKTKVSDLDKGYSVAVSSDKNVVALIKTVEQGLSRGKSLSSFQKDINTINAAFSNHKA